MADYFSTATLVMLRTNGFVVPVFVAVWFAWRGNWRLALAIASTCIVVFFALMAARLIYYGLERPVYEAQGYVLRYLVRSRSFGGPEVLTLSQNDIKDVTGFTQAGYFYGCAVNAGLGLPLKNP